MSPKETPLETQIRWLHEYLDMELGEELRALAEDVREFLTDRVPQEPHVPALKCAKEAAEFAENPCVEEGADVLITLLGWIKLNGVSPDELVQVARDKMERNLARAWELQPDGTWQHVEPRAA